MASPRLVAALVGCVAFLLARPVNGDSSLEDTSKTPGNAKYWVKLQSLGTSEGHWTPEQFDPDHAEYDLTVTSFQSRELVLTFGLDLSKYNLQHTPVIEVDGKKLDYTPLTIISTVIKLDEDIGPFDRVVHVLVRDPNPGNFWHHTNRQEYNIHIRQPPEYSKLVIAEDLVVTGSSGKEIVAKPPFDRKADKVDYFYNISEHETGVTIDFACPRFTTKVLFNEHPVPMFSPRGGWSPSGTSQYVDVSTLSRHEIEVACVYEGAVRRSRRDYMLTLNRDVHIDPAVIKPKLLPDLGYCLSRLDYNNKAQTSFAGDEKGFVCLTDSLEPRIMVAEADDPRASQAIVWLRDLDSPFQVQLQPFLPFPISHERTRHRFMMNVQLGSVNTNVPVRFLFPASCEQMHCPKHYRLRSNSERQAVAKWRLCAAETCHVDVDRDTCCEKVAPCSSVTTCPKGKDPASDMDCYGPTCTKADELRCCNHQEYCIDTDCAVGFSLRSDAATTPCKSKLCTFSDQQHCCEKQASCSAFVQEFGCSKGDKTPADVDKRHCLRGKCTKQDQLHCCEALTTCENFGYCPAGYTRRKEAADLTCYGNPCKPSDASRCCEKIASLSASNEDLPVKQTSGVIEKINSDGTFAVKYTHGRVDRRVPEWALRSNGSSSQLNFRVGDGVMAAFTEAGYHHHRSNTGWVEKANPDGTYTVKFDNSEWDAHVPAWAVRAVDSHGDRFVHTGMLSPGQRIYTSRKKNKQYKRMSFAIGTVVAKHSDDTFTVQYASGSTDEHVPVWDLRAITAEGRSHVQPDYKAGEYVEVADQEKARKEEFEPSLRDRLRTKFVFGFVKQVNPDGTYGIKYDFGGWEDGVPNWAIRKYADGESHKQMKYKYNDRVEARVSEQAGFSTIHEVITLGIAARERLHLYKEIECWPAAQKCRVVPKPVPGVPTDTPEELPELSKYDVVSNPDNLTLCYYDDSCSSERDLLGCGKGVRRNCRQCGHGDFPQCPEPVSCKFSEEDPIKNWTSSRKEWCCKYYNIGCPYVCRWGKYWPDEAKGWGPWWSPEKRTWCCENKKIGCPRLEHTFDVLVTTTVPPDTTTVTTTTITAICQDGYTLTPVESGECPEHPEDLDHCEQAAAGRLCTGTGLCYTNTELNNCNQSDVYLKQAASCPDSEGVQGYRFAHAGYWIGGKAAGSAHSAAGCAVECDKNTRCTAFSWQQESNFCLVHTELGHRVLGGPSLAFERCTEEGTPMASLQVKFDGRGRRQPEQAGVGVFRGSVHARAWLEHATQLAPVLFAGTSALALFSWAWRSRRQWRRRNDGLPATARALSVASHMGAPAPRRPPPSMAAGSSLQSMVNSACEDPDEMPLLC